MPIFLRWVWAVTRHWIRLLGGATVSVALLIRAQYAPDPPPTMTLAAMLESNRLPAHIWWSGIVGGFVLACYAAWKDEWKIATALAIQRPAFAHQFAGIEQWEKQDGTLIDDRFNVKFVFTNTSEIPVDEMTYRVLMLTRFDAPPVSDSGYNTSANRTFGGTSIRSAITVIPLLPPHYFAVDLSYKDARNGAEYWQQMFYKWIGSREHDFDFHFRSCTMEERRLIETYMATMLKPSMSRTAAPSHSRVG